MKWCKTSTSKCSLELNNESSSKNLVNGTFNFTFRAKLEKGFISKVIFRSFFLLESPTKFEGHIAVI